uniref:Putative ribonuclease H-like domain-containing protein n=1 Tax=Tanacetum cinerariifolium TaxID=118510 RepID=A0A699JNB3_TANCI|nr:putative ribonuclease H-like domain-containing protein [Tanacetum cinerariifolium]
MRIESVNGKKYILVIVDDYSQLTWMKFLRSKDETLTFMIKYLKIIQVRLNATVRNIRTDNGTEFVNQTLKAYYEDVEISHQTSIARTPQQNGVIEIRNQTLLEVASTMLICSKDLLFLWAEAITTACYSQNHSLIRKRHNKTPYEHLHEKTDLTSGPALQQITPRTISSGLMRNPSSSTPHDPPTKNDWDLLFQPMFDEYFKHPPSVVSPVPVAAAPRLADPTGSPSSTFIDQDAPSPSTSLTTHER